MLRSLAEARSFHLTGWEVDGPLVRLRYRVGDDLPFVEEVELPPDLVVPDGPAAEVALRLLHLCAGVSYYKLIAPRPLVVEGGLTGAEEALARLLYDDGLREHAYRNGLPIPLPVALEADRLPDPAPAAPRPDRPPLVPVGGGKDSALVADVLPGGVLMAVNPTGAHERLAHRLGRPLVRVRRRLDPTLRELNEAGAPNGHVPVTAINSAVAALTAVALDLADVAMGLERSASEPTLHVGGHPVNHQLSKSLRAEELLAAALAPAGVRYFSLLRPYSELAIAALVGERGLAADVLSCNRAFALWRPSAETRHQRPCGTCPKCLFSSLVLAPTVGPEGLARAYGSVPLDRPELVGGFRALWSDGAKPFECVGERLESAAAMAWLAQRPEWAGSPVVAALGPEAAALVEAAGATVAELLRPGPADLVPEEHRAVVGALSAQLAAVAARVAGAPR